MKQVLYLVLILGPLVWYSLCFTDRSSVQVETVTTDSIGMSTTDSLFQSYAADVSMAETPLIQRIKSDFDEQVISAKEYWLGAIPKIILFLFAFGLLYVFVAALKEMLSPSGMYAVFLLISILELIYFLALGGDTWFCSPDKVGWAWAVTGFLLFAGTLFLQYKTFELFIKGITGHGIIASFRIGVFIGAAGVGLWLLQSQFYSGNDSLKYIALGIIVLGQIVQLCININRLGWLRGMLFSILYIICFAAMVVSMWHLLKILLILFLIFCVVLGFIEGSGSNVASNHEKSKNGSPGSARNCPHFDSDQLCNFYGTPGSRSECGMWRDGDCQHNFWRKM